MSVMPLHYEARPRFGMVNQVHPQAARNSPKNRFNPDRQPERDPGKLDPFLKSNLRGLQIPLVGVFIPMLGLCVQTPNGPVRASEGLAPIVVDVPRRSLTDLPV